MNDERSAELLVSLREDSAATWPDFLDAFAPVIMAAARSVTRNTEDAGDAFVFACERLSERGCARLLRFDGGGKATFATWLRVVAVNLAHDWRRQRYGRPRAFRVIRALSPLHLALFQARFRDGLTGPQAREAVAARAPGVGAADLHRAEEEVEGRLTSRHRLALVARHAIGRPESVEALAELGAEVADADDLRPDEVFFRRCRGAELRRAVAALPVGDRLLIRLRFDRELTLCAVARAAGLKDAQTADRRLRSILARLRDALEPGSARVSGKPRPESV